MKAVATNPVDFLSGGFTMTKMIIVDRDGVINQDLDYLIQWKEESMPIAGSLEAIIQLIKAFYCFTIATHQPYISLFFSI